MMSTAGNLLPQHFARLSDTIFPANLLSGTKNNHLTKLHKNNIKTETTSTSKLTNSMHKHKLY